MSASRLGAVYAALMAAHDVADHVIQTDRQALRKREDWREMAGHVGSYQAAQALVLAALRPLGVRPAWWRLVLAAAWSAGSHAFLDRRWPVRWILDHTGSEGFAQGVFVASPGTLPLSGLPAIQPPPAQPIPISGPYLADQALHHACLFVAALILVAGST